MTHGTLDQSTGDFRDAKDLVGYFTVSISDIIRRLRSRAQAVGIDLDRAFFFPPDDPRFDQILTQVKRERDGRIARLRRAKKKLATVKAQRRRSDIAAMPRVKNDMNSIALQIE